MVLKKNTSVFTKSTFLISLEEREVALGFGRIGSAFGKLLVKPSCMFGPY